MCMCLRSWPENMTVVSTCPHASSRGELVFFWSAVALKLSCILYSFFIVELYCWRNPGEWPIELWIPACGR